MIPYDQITGQGYHLFFRSSSHDKVVLGKPFIKLADEGLSDA